MSENREQRSEFDKGNALAKHGDASRKSRGRKKTSKPQQKKSKGSQRKQPPKSKLQQMQTFLQDFTPVTINGIPSSKIVLEGQRKLEESSEKKETKPKLRLSKKKRTSILQQYIKRFIESKSDLPIYYSIRLRPSDPEFPFDLDELKLSLCIPPGYPQEKKAKPSIVVLNDNIPKGFAVNIERGFKRIVSIGMENTVDDDIQLVDGNHLLSYISTLSKYLELFLKINEQEVNSVRIVKTTPLHKSAEESAKTLKKSTQSQKPAKQTRPARNGNEKWIGKKTLGKRAALIEEVKLKMGSYVKVMNKTDDSRYRVQIPLYSNSIDSPATLLVPEPWKSCNYIELFLNIPKNYPESSLSVSFPKNFSENLTKLKDIELLDQSKKAESNVIRNFESFHFNSDNLVFILNWLSNHVCFFCLNPVEFEQVTLLF